ncbi:hypothetical protein LP420_35845 [Massilia sp. B-10]|nr:hypothetical protein LP420_35845 [Massilia sp. B-10]
MLAKARSSFEKEHQDVVSLRTLIENDEKATEKLAERLAMQQHLGSDRDDVLRRARKRTRAACRRKSRKKPTPRPTWTNCKRSSTR